MYVEGRRTVDDLHLIYRTDLLHILSRVRAEPNISSERAKMRISRTTKKAELLDVGTCKGSKAIRPTSDDQRLNDLCKLRFHIVNLTVRTIGFCNCISKL